MHDIALNLTAIAVSVASLLVTAYVIRARGRGQPIARHAAVALLSALAVAVVALIILTVVSVVADLHG